MAAGPEFILRPVREINWATLAINRSSVVPIVKDKTHQWIGLGINADSANLTTIGGGYEKWDHDLLSTAVREWNEEMVPNVTPLSEVDLYKRYAIQSRSFINVLLPSSKFMKFQPTTELYSMIWVTPGQLKAMHQHQTTILSATDRKISETIGTKIIGSRAYLFTRELATVAESLAEVVATKDVFTPTSNRTPFERPRREIIQRVPTVIVSVDQFLSEISPSWHSPAMILTSKDVVVYRTNRTMYKLPRSELPRIVEAINRNRIRVLIALSNDLRMEPLKSSDLKNQNVIIVEDKLRRNGLSSDLFIDEIKTARSLEEDERIVTEAELIFQYEYQAYTVLTKSKENFNLPRACFLQILNLINHKLSMSKVPISYMMLIRALAGLKIPKCPAIMTSVKPTTNSSVLNLHQIILFLIKTGVLLQDPATTVITLP